MSRAADQLRCLGDDDVDTTTSWPLIYWQKKQVFPIGEVNVYTVSRELGEEVMLTSPALAEVRWQGRFYPEPLDPSKPSPFAEMARLWAEDIADAERLQDMRAPSAFGW